MDEPSTRRRADVKRTLADVRRTVDQNRRLAPRTRWLDRGACAAESREAALAACEPGKART
jgi:hypothetical protein